MIPWHQPEVIVHAVQELINQESHQKGAEDGLQSRS